MKRKLPSSKNVVTKKQQQLADAIAFDKMVAKWENIPKFSQLPHKSFKRDNALSLNLVAPTGRETVKIKSVVTNGAWTSTKDPQQYTGSKMIGVGQMHKSNAVPIFNNDSAEDIAKMRRN